jgi:hypothetical protein
MSIFWIEGVAIGKAYLVSRERALKTTTVTARVRQ